MFRRAAVLTVTVLLGGAALTIRAQQPQPQTPAPATNLGSDANPNPRRLAPQTGHISNYDATKLKPYTLPDPLVLPNGQPVRDARTWPRRPRPEIVGL